MEKVLAFAKQKTYRSLQLWLSQAGVSLLKQGSAYTKSEQSKSFWIAKMSVSMDDDNIRPGLYEAKAS